LIADLAYAAGEPLEVALSHPIAAVGDPVEVDVVWRSARVAGGPLDADAVLRCGTRETPIRLWPSGKRGRFRGSVDAALPGRCTVVANIRPLGAATAPLLVTEVGHGPKSQSDDLGGAIRALGGTMVAAGEESTLVTELRAFASPQRVATPVHPMRSPWWIGPFAACVSLEWWLRRRKGLR